MPLDEDALQLRNRLLDELGTKKAFRLRNVKQSGRRLVLLVLYRERFDVYDDRLRELQRQLKLNFTKQNIILSGNCLELDHALSRLLPSGKIIKLQHSPKKKPAVLRRRQKSSCALAY